MKKARLGFTGAFKLRLPLQRLRNARHRHNKGLIDPTDATKGYYGFSKNGKIKIGFYYIESDGYIGSFFPILNP